MAGMKAPDGYKVTELGVIPEEWEVRKIQDFCTTSSGGTPSRRSPEYYSEGTIPWIKTGELTGKYIYDSEEKISEKALSNSSAKMFQENTILVAMYGATIGKSSILKIPAATNQACCAINCNPKYAYHEFLYYSLQYRIDDLVDLGAGGAQPNISQQIMADFPIALPYLPEQQKIADILSTVDEHIRETEELIEKTKTLKQGMMQRLLTRGIRHTEFKETEIGRIPAKWEVLPAGELFENISLKNFPEERILTVTQEFGAVYRDESGMDIQSNENSWGSFKLVCPGDFVISLRSFQGGIEYSRIRGIVSPAYTVLKSKTDIFDDFFRHFFKSPKFIKYLSSSVIGIRDGKQISYPVFKNLLLPKPSTSEQKQIALSINAVEDQIGAFQSKLDSLTRLKSGLMQQLLTGRIRVKV